jgi:hypothetical protein
MFPSYPNTPGMMQTTQQPQTMQPGRGQPIDRSGQQPSGMPSINIQQRFRPSSMMPQGQMPSINVAERFRPQMPGQMQSSAPQGQMPPWAQHLSPIMQKAMFGQPYASPFGMGGGQNALARPQPGVEPMPNRNALAMWGR